MRNSPKSDLDIEKLSRYSGDHCISLTKKDSGINKARFEELYKDKMTVLDFDDNGQFLMILLIKSLIISMKKSLLVLVSKMK